MNLENRSVVNVKAVLSRDRLKISFEPGRALRELVKVFATDQTFLPFDLRMHN